MITVSNVFPDSVCVEVNGESVATLPNDALLAVNHEDIITIVQNTLTAAGVAF